MLLRLTFAATLLGTAAFAQEDPLPSWNDGPTKQAILDFVSAATTEGGPDLIAPGDRIATFDNDGTLWSEQPMYFQGMFVNDRIKALAADNPDWASTMPFKAVLDGDMAALGAAGEKGLVELLAATHAGMTNEEFEAIVKDWIATARHPRFDRPYTDLVFQPMLEVLDYLRANDFQTWIVSGGGIDFMRPWTEPVYGIPPWQVIGSQIEVDLQRQGRPAALRPRARGLLRRRQGGQAGRHPPPHRPRAGDRLRQLRRRLPDARVRHRRRRPRPRPDRPPHRRRPRVRLRPRQPRRHPRPVLGACQSPCRAKQNCCIRSQMLYHLL